MRDQHFTFGDAAAIRALGLGPNATPWQQVQAAERKAPAYLEADTRDAWIGGYLNVEPYRVGMVRYANTRKDVDPHLCEGHGGYSSTVEADCWKCCPADLSLTTQ